MSKNDSQIKRINEMTERHMAQYKQTHEAIQKAAKDGDITAISEICQQALQESEKFMSELDAEEAIIEKELRKLGIKI